MTSHTTYTCNFCNTTIKTGTNAGIGVRWSPSDTLEQKPINDVHNHLCVKCLTAIRILANGYIEPEPPTP